MVENKIGISGADYIIPPKTDHPFWSDEDIAENLTATATVDNSTGTPSVDVTKNGYNLNFDFKNLKGEKGDKGDTGAKGTPGADGKNGTSVIVSKVNTPESGAVVGRITGLKSQELDPTIPSSYETIEVRNGEKGDAGATGTTPDITATATVNNTTGTPAVTVTKSGTTDAPTLAFAFSGIKGEKGEKGEQGDAGATGTTPDITATATVNNMTGTPAVRVAKSGTTDAPTFAFAFSGIKGEKGEKGADADVSKCVTNVSVKNSGNTYTVKQTKGDGTTTDAGHIVVPNKMNDPKTVDNAYTPINAEGEVTLDSIVYMYLYIDDEFTFSEDGIQGLSLNTNISTILPIRNGRSYTVPVTITNYNSYNCSIFRAVCSLTVNNNTIESMQYRFYLMGGNYTSLVGLTWNNRTKVVFKKVSTL